MNWNSLFFILKNIPGATVGTHKEDNEAGRRR